MAGHQTIKPRSVVEITEAHDILATLLNEFMDDCHDARVVAFRRELSMQLVALRYALGLEGGERLAAFVDKTKSVMESFGYELTRIDERN